VLWPAPVVAAHDSVNSIDAAAIAAREPAAITPKPALTALHEQPRNSRRQVLGRQRRGYRHDFTRGAALHLSQPAAHALRNPLRKVNMDARRAPQISALQPRRQPNACQLQHPYGEGAGSDEHK